MLRSFRLRLLVVMVALPVCAVLAVGFAVGRNNQDRLGDLFVAKAATTAVTQKDGEGLPSGLSATPTQASKIVAGSASVVSGALTLPADTAPIIVHAAAGGTAFEVYADPALPAALDAERAKAVGSLNRYLAISTAVAAAVAALAAFMLARGVTRPVEALTKAARRMEAGDLSHRVQVASRDEIGVLAHAFNEMAQTMERNIALRRRMASDVAHELRTPLNNLSGYLDAIEDGVVQADSHVVASLQQEAAALVRLVQDIEQVSLADAGELQIQRMPLDLRDVAQSALAAADGRATNLGVRLQSELPDEPVMIDGDPLRLGQVLRNLLDNALTHTPLGGTVDLSVGTEDHHPYVVVEDTGAGIPPKDLPHVFDRFYRADPSRTRETGGAGLGLAIARQIIEAHGGQITAENALGRGARFRVALSPASLKAPL